MEIQKKNMGISVEIKWLVRTQMMYFTLCGFQLVKQCQ